MSNPIVTTLPNRIATVGAYGVGKDYVLKAFGYDVLGFADPLYDIAVHAFGTSDKKLPGMREFLQKVGQWGRGTISEEYPLDATRATFVPNRLLIKGNPVVEKMRADISGKYGVDWNQWGMNDIWVDALVRRLVKIPTTKRIGVSNVRFGNELTKLKASGAGVWLVLATPAELKARRKEAGLSEKGTNDTSEQLAKALARAVGSEDTILRYANGSDTLPEVPVTELIAGVIWNSEEEKLDKYLHPSVPVFRMARGSAAKEVLP